MIKITLQPETMARLWSHQPSSAKRSSAAAEAVINRALDALAMQEVRDAKDHTRTVG